MRSNTHMQYTVKHMYCGKNPSWKIAVIGCKNQSHVSKLDTTCCMKRLGGGKLLAEIQEDELNEIYYSCQSFRVSIWYCASIACRSPEPRSGG